MTSILRRVALAAGLAAAVGALASAAQAAKDDDKSWVGKTVLPKKPDPVGAIPTPLGLPQRFGPDGKPVELPQPLHGASWEVKEEKGTRVQVIDDGLPVWVEKDLLVPLADAVGFFTEALKGDAPDAYAHNFRGWAQYLLGKPDAAVKDFDAFLERFPADGVHRATGLSNRGLVLAESGRFVAALKDLDEAVRLGYAPGRLNRGWAHELKGAYKEAAADYAALLADTPINLPVLNNSAWLKATCPDAAFRDGKEAVRVAAAICEMTGDREGAYLDTLAAAHAEAGDFAAAVKAQEKALDDPGYAKRYGADGRKRLQLYKDQKPFRTAPLKAK